MVLKEECITGRQNLRRHHDPFGFDTHKKAMNVRMRGKKKTVGSFLACSLSGFIKRQVLQFVQTRNLTPMHTRSMVKT